MWKYHLLSLDKLKYGINLRAYAQKDPLIEYKKEAFALFEDMMLRIEEQIVMHISFIKITDDSQQINILSDTNDSNIEQSKIDPIEFTLGIKKVLTISNPIINHAN